MSPLVLLRLALRALKRHKLRSALTILGVVIGVAAVIAMVSLGAGAEQRVQREIASLGTEMIIVFPGSTARGGVHGGMGSQPTLTEDDAQAIERECSAVREVAPSMRSVMQVVSGHENWATTVVGTSDNYPEVRQWKVIAGRFFSQSEYQTAAKVCVLGTTVASEIFGDRSPIGQSIRVKNTPCRVIGLLDSKGQNPMGQDQDDTVVVPLTTYKRRITNMPSAYIGVILAAAQDAARVSLAAKQVKELLRQRHRLADDADDDFSLRTIQDLASTAQETTRVLSLLLAGIATISLLVGGIGIMNIMLVSVTERTHEIGIRMAVGARNRDILAQFLVEAVVLSLVGGVGGMALGAGAAHMMAKIGGWPTALGPELLLLAVGFAVLVGVFFGFYPARRASQQSPIEALRYE